MESLKNNYFDHLKKDICIRSEIGMLNFSDSLLLSAKMASAGVSISAHTIARFYGFLPQRKFYPATLRAFCNYLGFRDFEEYVAFKQRNYARSLLTKSTIFNETSFSEYSFQLAFELVDTISIKNHLEALDSNHEKIEQLAHLTGFLIRKSQRKEELLQLLIAQKNGRTLFYERFVDEDDPNGYYSDALKKYYLNAVQTKNNKLFYFTYLIANAIYKSKPLERKWCDDFVKLSKSVDLRLLHFHEVSRLMEVKVLLLNDACKNDSIFKISNEIFSVIGSFDQHAKAWILARLLKALAFKNKHTVLTNAEEVRSLLDQVHTSVSIESIGELIVQLFLHADCKGDNLLNSIPPLQLDGRFTDNEFATRISVETATRFIFSDEKEQKMLCPQLISFCKNSGNTWVLNLLRSSS